MTASFAWSEYEEHPFDRAKLSQDRLDVSGSRRLNALPWRGQFSPELAELIIEELLPEGIILDPFCGSGTTLIEAARLNHSSVGSEINPAAYILSRAYELLGVDLGERLELLAQLEREVRNFWSGEAAFTEVAHWAKSSHSPAEKSLRDAIFLLAAGNDSTIKPGRLEKAFRQVFDLIISFPDCDADISVHLGDARRIKAPPGSAAGLLTSPPYINVFNYHQNYRSAVEALGWGVLSSAVAEFGSNRKHRQNRFLTVVQYAQDITEALQESCRIVKPGGTSVWVVGRESKIRGVAIPNPAIIFEGASRGAGLTLTAKHERSFTSRYGQRVYEDLLVFHHPELTPRVFPGAELLGREIGTKILESVIGGAGDASDEVGLAIVGAERVRPSSKPVFSYPELGNPAESRFARIS